MAIRIAQVGLLPVATPPPPGLPTVRATPRASVRAVLCCPTALQTSTTRAAHRLRPSPHTHEARHPVVPSQKLPHPRKQPPRSVHRGIPHSLRGTPHRCASPPPFPRDTTQAGVEEAGSQTGLIPMAPCTPDEGQFGRPRGANAPHWGPHQSFGKVETTCWG